MIGKPQKQFSLILERHLFKDFPTFKLIKLSKYVALFFTKIQCISMLILFIVAQYKISYCHRNCVTNCLLLFYFQTWPKLWDESNDIGRSKTTAAISWHPQGKDSNGQK